MRLAIIFLKWVVISFILIFVLYAISYFLSPPWNNINIILLAVIVFLIGWESGASIWLAIFLFFLMELYSISPFGLILLSGAISVMLVFWLYIFIFTNRSWTSAAALSAVAVTAYRLLHTAIFIAVENFNNGFNINWRVLTISYLWELSLTAIATGLIIFIFSKTWKRFNPSLPMVAPDKFINNRML